MSAEYLLKSQGHTSYFPRIKILHNAFQTGRSGTQINFPSAGERSSLYQNTTAPVIYPSLLLNSSVFAQNHPIGSLCPGLNPSFLIVRNDPPTIFQDFSNRKQMQKTSQIELQTGFLKPIRFLYNDNDPKKVYTFSGLSFSENFETTMSEYPPALQEAKKALTYNAFATVGYLGMFAMSLKMLISTVTDANEVSGGDISEYDEESGMSDVVLIASFAVVGGVFSLLGKSRLDAGVKMFNTH